MQGLTGLQGLTGTPNTNAQGLPNFPLDRPVFSASPDLIFTVNTANAGSASNRFELPVQAATNNSCTIFWGDGTSEAMFTTTTAGQLIGHDYPTPGTYQIRVSGTNFSGFRFNNSGDRLKLLSVDTWGSSIVYEALANAFNSCTNLTSVEYAVVKLSASQSISNFLQNTGVLGTPRGFDKPVTGSSLCNAATSTQLLAIWDPAYMELTGANTATGVLFASKLSGPSVTTIPAYVFPVETINLLNCFLGLSNAATFLPDLSGLVNVTNASGLVQSCALPASEIDKLVSQANTASWVPATNLGIHGGTNFPPREDHAAKYTSGWQETSYPLTANGNSTGASTYNLSVTTGTPTYSAAGINTTNGTAHSPLGRIGNLQNYFELEFWTTRAAAVTTSARALVSHYGASGARSWAVLADTSNNLVFRSSPDGTAEVTTASLYTLPLNTEVKLRLIYDSGRVTLYVNDVWQASTTTNVAATLFSTTSALLMVGSFGGVGVTANYYPGAIRNLSIKGQSVSRVLVANTPTRNYRGYTANNTISNNGTNANVVLDAFGINNTNSANGAVISTVNGRPAIVPSATAWTLPSCKTTDLVVVLVATATNQGSGYVLQYFDNVGGVSRAYLQVTNTPSIFAIVGNGAYVSNVSNLTPDATYIYAIRLSGTAGRLEVGLNGNLIQDVTAPTIINTAPTFNTIRTFLASGVTLPTHALYLLDARDYSLTQAMAFANSIWSVY